MYITINVTTNVITYANILTCHFPCNSLSPAIVDDIIDGNLSSVDIAKNLDVFIGNSPPIYTNKSFGVPGIKNNKTTENEENKKDKEYILKEAEMLVNNYISKIENKDNSKIIINKDKKDKYTKLKKYSIAITVLCIIQTLILIF